jgi:hypothetical protein
LLVGGLIAVAVILVGALIAFLLVIANHSTPTQNAPAPYNFDLRPAPATNDIRVLLPPTVGTFSRRASTGNLTTGVTGSADGAYTSTTSADTVQIKIIREANVSQAQADVSSRGDQIVGTDKQRRINTGYSFVLSTEPSGEVRFIFASTYWLFDVTASSRAALDTFMKAYPF